MKNIILRETKDIEQTVQQYTNTIYKIALSFTKNRETAEDIMQNVFVSYITTDYTFCDNEHKKAWIIRVTINECKKYFRRLKYQLKKDEIKIIESEDPGIDHHDMYYAVMELPQKYRVVIHLYYYEQLTVKEISEILHKKENTIMSLLHRARHQLKKIMEVNYEYQ